jgi:RNA polymerase sigma-70 factor (ECF subfamily)
MDERDWLTERFQEHRRHLRAVASKMLGSVSEADDALQETWLRIRDEDPGGVQNLQAWLTTVVSRVCLNMLRSRRSRREQLSPRVPDPVVSFGEADDPEQEVLLGDSLGLALLVVLDALSPAERVAFVMHDVFGLPFTDVAATLDRSQAAAQQLASRARRRVRGWPQPEPDVAQQRRVVDAFFAASRDGDLDALMAVLDPGVELRVDGGARRRRASVMLRGAASVAGYTTTYAKLHASVIPALVNGAPGAVIAPAGRTYAVMSFTVTRARITRIDALVDPERIVALDLGLPPGVTSD